MKLQFGSCLLALSLPLLVPAGSLFPEFDEIPAALRFPRRAKVTISKDGDYLINGIPRFMIGTELDIERIAEDMMPTEGYPDNLKWLYEGPLSYRTAQRAGIDAISLQFPPNWIHEIYPAWKPYRPQGKNKEYASQVLANGLPIRMDTSCQFWKHGRLALKRLHPELHELLPQEAYGKGHFIEYNIFHPEARKIYKRYWEAALDMYQDELNRPPIDVELFNEPSYDDPSPYNRELFAKYLEEKYESVDAMNRLWRTEYPSFEAASQFRQRTDHAGLYVDWGKFMEKGMTDINRFGRDVVKSKSPSTTVSFQIMGMDNYRRLPATNMNSYEVQKLMDVIALPTGAGLEFSTDFDRAPARSVEAPGNPGGIGEGMLMRAFYLNVGEGKPLINAEAYTGNTFDMISNQLWMDMIRGTSITYLFGWGKGAQNWKPRGKAEGGKRFAEQYRYPVLNPYGKPPEAIAALYHTKAEIFRFNDYFVPRDRGVKAQVALLFSYPTERFGGFSGNSIKNEIRKDVVGQEEIVDSVITAIIAGGNVLLEGVPGVGKTRLVRSFSKTLSLPFSRIQFTPDLMPSDVTGTNVIEKDAEGKMNTVFRRGPIFANLILADEINRTTPKTQSAMLEVMQEHKVTVGDTTYAMEEPFFVLATENPIEQDGTYPLPEAQMDRFMFKLIMKFPSVEELAAIVNMTQITMAETANAVVDGATILEMRELAKHVPIIDEVLNYAMNLVANTHPELESSPEAAKKYIKYGASPRAAQNFITCAKVRALMNGNYNVSYEDIDALAYPILRHRLKINYNAVNDKLTVEDVIGLILKQTKKK